MRPQPRHATKASLQPPRRRPRTSRLVLVGLVVGAALGTTGAVLTTRAIAGSSPRLPVDKASHHCA